MSDWNATGGADSWQADDAGTGFAADTGASNGFNDFNATEDTFGAGGAGEQDDNTCRNCGSADHFARECDQPRKMTGECFRCGQVGHNKADCTNEPIERPFTGQCRVCQEEGHPASQCPQQICRLCQKGGHKAMDCKERRALDFEGAPETTAEAAWEAMVAADKEKDLDEFRKAFMSYVRAAISAGGPESFNLTTVETTFRTNGMNAHLIAKEKDIPLSYTIVDFQGNSDKTYVLGIQWKVKSRRPAFNKTHAETDEENLARLADCGLVVDRGIPVCGNCKELGHIAKHCKSEPTMTKEAHKCSNCQSEGHRLRDCPEERVEKRGGGGVCRNCQEPGHKAADCTEPRVGGDRPPMLCRNCNQEGHKASDCTEPRNPATVTCRNCDGVGHFSKDCPKPRDYSRITCENCNQKGHTKVRCKAPPAEADSGAGGDGGWGAGDQESTAGAGAGAGAAGGWNDSPAEITAGGW